MGLLNGSFEDWNFGTLFSDPLDGAQLADYWYWHKGSATPTTIWLRSSFQPFEGTYKFQGNGSTGQGGGANSSSYIYQDISNYVDYQGLSISVTAAFAWSTGFTQMYIEVYDGVNTYQSPYTTVNTSATWQQVSVVVPVDIAATELQVRLRSVTYNNIFIDAVTLSINLEQIVNDDLDFTENFFYVLNGAIQLALTDSLVIADTLIPPTGPVTRNKATDDTVLLQDWLRIKRRPKQWGN